ncbi:DUF4489 domain-containing protein [Clostridium tyrobutyricum]|uniref:DUF4489 domain-containing protein n=1 Tax=Clostridium tyrobutyricum TaxID=1519 RepID=UPI001C38F390|nr:DUF4489 domain-containing protein [Clostridium tyrobutyricum]MBV4419820.1 DUF4489 domain-containing protein [Clostridium tyrobutyricum]
MNSMSKYYKDDCDPCKKDKNDEKGCQSIVKCSCPSSFKLPGVTLASTFTIASLRLNTSKLHNPCVKLEFVTNLDIVGVTVTDNLKFQLFKHCDGYGEAVPVGPSWTFGPIGAGSDTFSFFVCDCDCDDDCDTKCCTYTAKITSAIAITAGSISLTNTTLAATATSRPTC